MSWNKKDKQKMLELAREVTPLDTGKLRKGMRVKGSRKKLMITINEDYGQILEESSNHHYLRTKFIGQSTKGYLSKRATAAIISFLEEKYNSGSNTKKAKRKAGKKARNISVANKTLKGKRGKN